MPSESQSVHVNRIIRTPKATISIRGELDDVDSIYRTINKSLLDSGKYTIPAPDQNPWQQYGTPAEDNTDHLRRRVTELEHNLADSSNHELIQSLRRQLVDVTLDRDTWRDAFTTVDDQLQAAARTLLNKEIPPELSLAIVTQQLSE